MGLARLRANPVKVTGIRELLAVWGGLTLSDILEKYRTATWMPDTLKTNDNYWYWGLKGLGGEALAILARTFGPDYVKEENADLLALIPTALCADGVRNRTSKELIFTTTVAGKPLTIRTEGKSVAGTPLKKEEIKVAGMR